jgi:hypothetical protein
MSIPSPHCAFSFCSFSQIVLNNENVTQKYRRCHERATPICHTHVMLGFCAVPARADATGGGWLMPSQSVENWERKAAQARHAADLLMGNSAKATMLEMADYYGKLASAAHRDIAKPARSNDSPQ